MRSWWERGCTPETPSPCRGAAGKLYLASLPEQELADHLAAPLARPTPYTITSPSALRDEIDECRQTGNIHWPPSTRQGGLSQYLDHQGLPDVQDACQPA
ncbi:IclR family transcriptional regulator domain-containing protein [Streptomyces asiaticus]|uniref:IclR family transcriptional regulator domain-containing protein n=1 Tax=Streptomyces asiaticus TaxID=114695 RepID=UPI003D75C88B